MSQQGALAALKDNSILGSVNRSIASRAKDIITPFYSVFIRSYLNIVPSFGPPRH